MSKPEFNPIFLRGVQHFNALEFWDAHESWEQLWLVAESDLEQFLQGLIQVAAAYHHLKRGTFRGGVRLFDSGLRRLSHFPNPYCGIDRSLVERTAREHRAWAVDVIERGLDRRLTEEQYPKLELVKSSDVPMPPSSAW